MRCFYVLKKWSSSKLSLNRDLSLNKMSLNRDCTVLPQFWNYSWYAKGMINALHCVNWFFFLIYFITCGCVWLTYRKFQSKFFDTFIWTFKWRSSRWNSAVLCSGYMLKGRKISNKYISLWSNSRSGPNSNKSSSFDKVLGSFKVAIISCGFEASWGCLIRSNSGFSLTWDIKGFEIVVDNGVIKSVLPISFFSTSELTTSWILVALALCWIVCLCTLPNAERRFLNSVSLMKEGLKVQVFWRRQKFERYPNFCVTE